MSFPYSLPFNSYHSSSVEKPETVANHLFKALRDFDKVDTEFIFGEAFSEKNVGQAIMNRLTKAAGYNIIDV